MLKKYRVIISLVLVLCMLCTLTLSVSAQEIAFIDSSIRNVVGVLTLDDGSQHQIVGTAVYGHQRSGQTDNAITYAFAVPASLAAGGSTTIHDWDDGNASIVYLTINYDISDDGSRYLLTSVSGYWVIEDRYASVESASLTYGCASTLIGRTQRASNVTVSNNFYISTGFTQYIPEVDGVMGANLTVNYLIGTSRRWSFTLTNNLFNNSILDLL